MASMRSSSLVALCLLAGACFNPEDVPGEDVTETDGMTGSTGGGPATSDPTTASTAPSTNSATDTESTTVGEAESDTETEGPTGDGSCGNGELDDDEACDDGTNDGSYGSCLEDCSGPAAFCGDGELSDDEVCDDGTNDGSYGGCEDDCTALGPYCGDTEVNGDEACDDGTNANGSPCSTGCALPGTVAGSHNQGPVTFCDGEFLTRPTFDDDGDAFVAVSTYCSAAESLLLLELSPEVELLQDFGLLLPTTPVREGTIVGDRWVLGANGCNYVVSAAGALTEVCEERNHGVSGLATVDASTYYALRYDGLARFGAGSPALGDSPEWEVMEPVPGTFTFQFNALAVGASNTAVIAGSRATATSLGYVAIYSAGGNLADDTWTTLVESFSEIAAGPMGSVAAGFPADRIVRFGPSLSVQWDLLVPAIDTPSLALDSLGNVIAAYRTAGGVEVRKLATDSSLLWTFNAPAVEARVAVDADDQVWLSSVEVGDSGLDLVVRKITP